MVVLADNIMQLLQDRYFQPGETKWEDIVDRVIKQLLDSTWMTKAYDHSRSYGDRLRTAMLNMQILPSSPVLMNAGTITPMMCSCFVIPVEDSIGGIMQSLSDTMMIQKYGGGVGLDFSPIRPDGSVVHSTNGRASGPVSFMGFWNEGMNVIKQGGKRQGALMGVLRIDHPDFPLLLGAKTEEHKLTNFNLSVSIPGDFWNSTDEMQRITKIAEGMWRNGEPGVLFLDNINENNPYGIPITATNPCFCGETKVWTINGPRSFGELASNGQDVDVLTQTEEGRLVFRTMHNPRLTGCVKIWEVELDNGAVLRVTGNHKLVMKDGTTKEVRQLTIGDSLASVYRYKANSKGYKRLTNGIDEPLEHHVVVERVCGRAPEYPVEHVHHVDGDKTNNTPDNLQIVSAHQHNSERMCGEGNPMYGIWDERNPLYGVDVSGENNPRYRKDVTIEEVIRLRDEGLTRKQIASVLGCGVHVVKNRIKWYKSGSNHKVVGVRVTDSYDFVYNGTVDETHSYFVMTGKNDAILSRNCGEVPLPPYGACCLGSINLEVCLNGLGPTWEFDWGRLARLARIAAHMLNAVLDTSWWPSREIEAFQMEHRPIGIGVMGLANVLIKLNMPYGEFGSRQFASKIMQTILEQAKESSGNNAVYTSIAPTGTIAMIAGTSYSIEPLFSLAYTKTVAAGTFQYAADIVHEVLDKKGLVLNPLDYQLLIQTGSVQQTGLPDDIKDLFRTAMELSPMEHLGMQAAVQRHTDSAVSKTINLPPTTTVEEIVDIIYAAHGMGLKGLTVYRTGSREVEVLTAGCVTGTCDL